MVPALAAGESTTVTLGAGEVLQLAHGLAIMGHDFTGTEVASSKPVGVFFTGNETSRRDTETVVDPEKIMMLDFEALTDVLEPGQSTQHGYEQRRRAHCHLAAWRRAQPSPNVFPPTRACAQVRAGLDCVTCQRDKTWHGAVVVRIHPPR